MENSIFRDDYRYLECAFNKFFALRYPFLIDTRVYTAVHHNCLHNHDFPQVWYCLSGRYQHRVEDRVYTCEKGSIVMVPAGAYHNFQISEGEIAQIQSLNVMYDVFLNVPQEQCFHAAVNLFLPNYAKELERDFPAYIQLSPESQAVYEKNTSWLDSVCFNLPEAQGSADIYEKLEQIFRVPEFAVAEQYRERAAWLLQTRIYPIMRALGYINMHYPERIAEEAVIRAAGTCRANLYRYFKQFTGYTYAVYLQWLRTKRVFRYLTYTTYPLSYISDICGFTNQAYMSQIFYKYMGITPSAFRTAQKKWLADQPYNKRTCPRC